MQYNTAGQPKSRPTRDYAPKKHKNKKLANLPLLLLFVALLALICLVSNLTVNLIQDRTAMTLLHTLCYVAMIPIFRRIGKIVMQCAEQTNE